MTALIGGNILGFFRYIFFRNVNNIQQHHVHVRTRNSMSAAQRIFQARGHPFSHGPDVLTGFSTADHWTRFPSGILPHMSADLRHSPGGQPKARGPHVADELFNPAAGPL